MKKTLLIAMIMLCSSFVASSARCAPQVVVSIKPIHALVAGVMQGIAEPQLLIKGGGSPHGYVLRPSEARALSRADLVVWVGPQLESFLEKSLKTLAEDTRQLELIDELKELLLPVREEGDWEGHEDHDGVGEQHLEAEHDKHDLNPHIWLSPLLAKQIVAKTAAVLTEIDPAQQAAYQQNAQQLSQRLDELYRQIKARLTPVRAVPYIVFHDAYPYFESAYGLNAVGSLTVDPERKPGAKRIRQMRSKINELQARCVFSEPQFEPRLVATIIEGTGARTGVLDPLGAELPVGTESYFQLLNALADNLLVGLR